MLLTLGHWHAQPQDGIKRSARDAKAQRGHHKRQKAGHDKSHGDIGGAPYEIQYP